MNGIGNAKSSTKSREGVGRRTPLGQVRRQHRSLSLSETALSSSSSSSSSSSKKDNSPDGLVVVDPPINRHAKIQINAITLSIIQYEFLDLLYSTSDQKCTALAMANALAQSQSCLESHSTVNNEGTRILHLLFELPAGRSRKLDIESIRSRYELLGAFHWLETHPSSRKKVISSWEEAKQCLENVLCFPHDHTPARRKTKEAEQASSSLSFRQYYSPAEEDPKKTVSPTTAAVGTTVRLAVVEKANTGAEAETAAAATTKGSIETHINMHDPDFLSRSKELKNRVAARLSRSKELQNWVAARLSRSKELKNRVAARLKKRKRINDDYSSTDNSSRDKGDETTNPSSSSSSDEDHGNDGSMVVEDATTTKTNTTTTSTGSRKKCDTNSATVSSGCEGDGNGDTSAAAATLVSSPIVVVVAREASTSTSTKTKESSFSWSRNEAEERKDKRQRVVDKYNELYVEHEEVKNQLNTSRSENLELQQHIKKQNDAGQQLMQQQQQQQQQHHQQQLFQQQQLETRNAEICVLQQQLRLQQQPPLYPHLQQQQNQQPLYNIMQQQQQQQHRNNENCTIM